MTTMTVYKDGVGPVQVPTMQLQCSECESTALTIHRACGGMADDIGYRFKCGYCEMYSSFYDSREFS